MNNNPARMFVVLAVILVLALILFGVYRTVQPTAPRTPTTPTINLLDYLDRDIQVRLSIEGPVTANENHNTIRIAITRDHRIIEGLSTYSADTTLSQAFPNNAAAFEDLIHALNNAGFVKRNPKATTASEIGACPSGQRYIYELIEGDKTVSRLWSSSCGNGTFAGQASQVRTLFQSQIPNYGQLTAGIRLSM